MSKLVAMRIAKELDIDWVDFDCGACLTEKGRRQLLLIAAEAVQKASQLFLKEQHGLSEETPEQQREEVTGLSTNGKSANFSNSGFGGGTMMRLAAA